MNHFEGSPLFRLCQKLKCVKLALKDLNKSQYGNTHLRSNQARAKLFSIQDQLKQNLGNPELKTQEKQALLELTHFSYAEESLLKQKSRNLWIAEGDSNSTYFHNCVKARINSNKILSITTADDTVLHEMPQIHEEAIAYYWNLLNDAVVNNLEHL